MKMTPPSFHFGKSDLAVLISVAVTTLAACQPWGNEASRADNVVAVVAPFKRIPTMTVCSSGLTTHTSTAFFMPGAGVTLDAGTI
jgi:hypothetical protein